MASSQRSSIETMPTLQTTNFGGGDESVYERKMSQESCDAENLTGCQVHLPELDTLAQERLNLKDDLCVTVGPKKDQQNDLREQQMEMSESSSFMKAFRIIMAIFMFFAILISVLASKMSFFVVIYRFRNAVNGTGTAEVLSSRYTLHEEIGETFGVLFIFIVVPHLFVILWSFWSGFIGKKTENYPWPTPTARKWAVLAGILESLGIVLFILEVCVDLSTPVAIALCNGIFFFPLLVPFESFKLSYQGLPARQPKAPELASDAAVALRKSPKRYLWMLCTVIQFCLLIAIPVLVSMHTKQGSVVNSSWRLIFLPVSIVCLSISWSGWLQHRVNECDFAGDINPFRTARWKSALITSSTKLVATISFFFIFDQVFKYDAVRFIGAGLRHIDGDSDMTAAVLVHIVCGLIAYALICAACAMTFHRWSMMLSLLCVAPLSLILSLVLCDGERFGIGNIGNGYWNGYSMCLGNNDHTISDNTAALVLACILWVTQIAYAILFVEPVTIVPLSREESMFHSPGYNPMFLDQQIFVNWRADHLTPPKHRRRLAGQTARANAAGNTLKKRKVYICSTMYREADYEQENLLKSIRHVHDAVRSQKAQNDNLEFESHVFFDGAVRNKTYSDFVLQLFSLVETTLGFDVDDVAMYETPYGMQANWNMRPARRGDEEEDSSLDAMDGIRFTVHLKDGHKYKNKKRWSQVMYMSYVLDYCCRQGGDNLDDTFILTTDADIVFSYSSVKALLDLMARDDGVGAVCARTHPTGSGPLVWYQIFDYAIGHWFQKTAEHVIGSVMCCPGCFSVFRCKALKAVLHVYATKVEHALEFLTKDMGEDRWLCTLLVERGWQLVYCAASENHTFCPESFEEFYKQRRRWIPSTLANLSLCVQHSKKIVQNNDAVGWWFILYQALMIFSTVIAPGTIILLISSGLVYAYGWDNIATLVIISITTVIFGYICIAHKKYEMIAAQVLTFIFSILMVAVFVGVIRQIVLDVNGEDCKDGRCVWSGNTTYAPVTGCDPGYEWVINCTTTEFLGAPIGVTSIYLAALTSMFLIAGMTHPSEFFCLIHGIWYLLCLPSGYIFLFVYSLCNMDSQSWGTREAKSTATGGERGKTKSWQETIQGWLRWIRETFGTPGYGPYGPHAGMQHPNGYVPLPQYQVPPGFVPVQQSGGEEALTKPPTLVGQQTAPSQPEESQSELATASQATESVSGTLQPHEETQPSKAPLPPSHTRLVRGVSHTYPGTAKPMLYEQQSHVFFDEDMQSIDFRSRASSGTSRQSERPGFSPDLSEEPILLCQTIDRTDIRTFLKGHQLEHLTERFQEEGYDDAMFLIGMTKDEMEGLGVDLSVRRSHLNREIKTLPQVPFEHDVPESIEFWLNSIGMSEYTENFRSNGYIADAKEDNIEGLKELTKEKLKSELGIRKKGHLKHLVKALKFVRYPTEREKSIRRVRKKITGRADPKLDKVEEKKHEQLFWEALREACMKPEMAVLGTNVDLAEKLIELRNASIMAVLIANILWVVVLQTLAAHPELNIKGTNPIGLMFLLVYGIVYVTQFLSMLVHRLITVMHMLAAAKMDSETPDDGFVEAERPNAAEFEAAQSNSYQYNSDGYQSASSYQGFDSDAEHQRMQTAPFGNQDDVSETAPLTGGGGGNRSRRLRH